MQQPPSAAGAVVMPDFLTCAWHGHNTLGLPEVAWRTLVVWATPAANEVGGDAARLAADVLHFCSPSCVVAYLTERGAHTVTRDPRAPGGYDRGYGPPKTSAPITRGGRTRGKRRET